MATLVWAVAQMLVSLVLASVAFSLLFIGVLAVSSWREARRDRRALAPKLAARERAVRDRAEWDALVAACADIDLDAS